MIPDGVSRSRYGKDSSNLLIHNDLLMSDGPMLGKETESFETCTDQRSYEILQLVNKNHKKLAVFWSGGIDSTVIVSAILKNWSVADQQNVVIFLNDYSLLENHIFFTRFIKDKFNYQFFNEPKSFPKLDNFIVTDGELADRLWSPQLALNYSFAYGDKSASNLWVHEKDNFIDFVIRKGISVNSARNIIERVDYNIQSSECGQQSLKDVLSWINFNFFWQQIYLSRYQLLTRASEKSFKEFKESYIPWYASNEYQKWAWAPSTREMINHSDIREYKNVAKKYVHGIINDSIFEYKTKMPSKMSSSYFNSNYIIFDNGATMETTDKNYEDLFVQYLLKEINA